MILEIGQAHNQVFLRGAHFQIKWRPRPLRSAFCLRNTGVTSLEKTTFQTSRVCVLFFLYHVFIIPSFLPSCLPPCLPAFLPLFTFEEFQWNRNVHPGHVKVQWAEGAQIPSRPQVTSPPREAHLRYICIYMCIYIYGYIHILYLVVHSCSFFFTIGRSVCFSLLFCSIPSYNPHRNSLQKHLHPSAQERKERGQVWRLIQKAHNINTHKK